MSDEKEEKRESSLELTGVESWCPLVNKEKTEPKYTGHICPYCGQRAKAYFLLKKGHGLDHKLGKIGVCRNPECLNSTNYSFNKPDPPYTEKEKKSKRIENMGGVLYEVVGLDVQLEEIRRQNLIQRRREKLKSDYPKLGCPVCKEWQFEVLENSAPGCFYGKCKCGYEAFIDRT